MEHPFTDEELVVIMEAALLGLADGYTFDSLAESLDLSDTEMKRIEEKLEVFMSGR